MVVSRIYSPPSFTVLSKHLAHREVPRDFDQVFRHELDGMEQI
jgi:hypothetical protein